jgi:hypothetical protein
MPYLISTYLSAAKSKRNIIITDVRIMAGGQG